MLIDYLPIFFVAILHFLLGMLWYSPALFGKAWMKEMKFSEADMKKAQAKSMSGKLLTSFISGLLMMFMLSYLMGFLFFFDVSPSIAEIFVGGSIIGFMIWLSFIAITLLGSVLWEGKSMKLYWINTGYYLVSFLVLGGLLAVGSNTAL